jgi:hypothetical protein
VKQAVNCIANLVKCVIVLPLVRASTFVGVTCDEGTIQRKSQLLVYYRIAVQGAPEVYFAGIQRMPNGKSITIEAGVRNRLAKDGIPIKQVGCFGSDGASPMAGVKNGAAVRLLRSNELMVFIHCICHRHCLSSVDAHKVATSVLCVNWILTFHITHTLIFLT